MERKLNITRPIVFLDTETTGVDRKEDRIVEIAAIKIDSDGVRTKKNTKVNPERPIPSSASEIHGIYDKDVQDAPTFKAISKSLLKFLDGCDIAGFNSNSFDVPLLYNEFERSGLSWDISSVRLIDAGNIFKILNPRTLSAAVLQYLGVEHTDAHGALADTRATMDVFFKQIETHEEIPLDVAELEVFCNYGNKRADVNGLFSINSDGKYIINFGQHKGKLAEENLSFLDWMSQRSFPTDALDICNSILYHHDY